MKIKLYVTTILLFSLYTSLISQNQNDTIDNFENTVVRIHVLPLGLCIENHLYKQATLMLDFGVGSYYQYHEFSRNKYSDFKLIPYLAVESRLYTNLQERKVKGKRIDYHSGAYGAFRLQGGFELHSGEWFVQFGPLVGFQRTLCKRGYWNIGIGCGSTIVEEDFKFGLIGDLKIGFIIN